MAITTTVNLLFIQLRKDMANQWLPQRTTTNLVASCTFPLVAVVATTDTILTGYPKSHPLLRQ